jgi:hypothetical protein
MTEIQIFFRKVFIGHRDSSFNIICTEIFVQIINSVNGEVTT